MADPLSIAAGVAGIAAATVHTIHTVVSLVDNIRDAPSSIHWIRNELKDVESVVHSLESVLNGSCKADVWTRLLTESKLSSALKTLRNVCANFATSLEKWTRRSLPGDKLSLLDGINVAMHCSQISRLSIQLDSCKQTVTMALNSCVLKGQILNHTAERTLELLTQEKEATRLHTAQRAILEGLGSEEQQLQLVKTKGEDAGDIDDMERAEENIRDVSRARMTISQFATVSEYIAKASVAARTNQDIGKVIIAELGYGAVGISNVDEMADIKQKIGDVSVGSGGTGFVGIHGKVDHNAALAGRWTSRNESQAGV